MPEDEIEAVQELPYLVDLKASEKADLKVRTSGLSFASGRQVSAPILHVLENIPCRHSQSQVCVSIWT